MKVNLEGRLWVVMDENKRPQGYMYRRRLPFFEKGIKKYRDVRKVLGSNLDQARAELKRLEAYYDEVERGEEPRRKATLGEFWKWYIEQIRDERKLLGWKTIRGETGMLVRFIGESVQMERITQADLSRFFEDRKTKVRPASVFSCFRHVRRMFRVARENRFLNLEGRLPIDGLKVPAPRVSEPKLPTTAEVRRLLDGLRASHLWLYRLVTALIFTGGRLGELLSLTWDQVGFVKADKDNTLTLIRRKVGDTLTLPMADRLHRELFAMWMERGQPLEGIVFEIKPGHSVKRYHALKTFKRDARKLGLGWLRLKDFRKLAATIPDMWDAVRLLGHSSPTMTANHYRGAWMESRTRAVNALEKALGYEGEEGLAEKWAVAPAGVVSAGQVK